MNRRFISRIDFLVLQVLHVLHTVENPGRPGRAVNPWAPLAVHRRLPAATFYGNNKGLWVRNANPRPAAGIVLTGSTAEAEPAPPCHLHPWGPGRWTPRRQQAHFSTKLILTPPHAYFAEKNVCLWQGVQQSDPQRLHPPIHIGEYL